mmetsp:Transcript_51576/g.117384  ORF Transcript_51576/g.117384 Transcript_51576/m.117384 type:complete len:319 (-) Transcript_51576:947-1903(-)
MACVAAQLALRRPDTGFSSPSSAAPGEGTPGTGEKRPAPVGSGDAKASAPPLLVAQGVKPLVAAASFSVAGAGVLGYPGGGGKGGGGGRLVGDPSTASPPSPGASPEAGRPLLRRAAAAAASAALGRGGAGGLASWPPPLAAEGPPGCGRGDWGCGLSWLFSTGFCLASPLNSLYTTVHSRLPASRIRFKAAMASSTMVTVSPPTAKTRAPTGTLCAAAWPCGSTASTTRVSSSSRRPMGSPRFMVKEHSSPMLSESKSWRADCTLSYCPNACLRALSTSELRPASRSNVASSANSSWVFSNRTSSGKRPILRMRSRT